MFKKIMQVLINKKRINEKKSTRKESTKSEEQTYFEAGAYIPIGTIEEDIFKKIILKRDGYQQQIK